MSGPAAATQPTAHALPGAERASTVVLVEGVSDQIAVETLLRTAGRGDIAVLPVGGAHGMRRHATTLAPGRRLVALCDLAEAPLVRRSLDPLGVGVLVCDRDLEDELIRAVTPGGVVRIVAGAGDLRSLHTLQRQAAWSDRPVADQLRRFLGAGATRKARYAALLTEAAITSGVVPPVLDELLAALDTPRSG